MLRVWFARSHQRVGATGLLGCALMFVALIVVLQAWRTHQLAVRERASVPQQDVLPTATVPGPAAPPRYLPDAGEVPRLLSRIERAATTAGLGWPRADYRFIAAAGDVPASVEVRCALTGPYPALRRFVTALLQDTPTLTLKEFSLSRSGADVAEVEAKFVIVVYVADRGSGVRP